MFSFLLILVSCYSLVVGSLAIIPIFDKYPLLTSKYFNYDLFKQAALIFSDLLLSKEKKDEL